MYMVLDSDFEFQKEQLMKNTLREDSFNLDYK